MFGSNVTLENVNVVRWVTLGGQLLFLLVPTLLLARARAPGARNFFRIHVPDLRQLFLVVVGVFALQQVLQGYMALQESIPLPEQIHRFVEEFQRMLEEAYRALTTARNPAELLVVVLIVSLVPSICEELLFRGLLQRTFESAVGGMPAAVLTGVIFGAYHVNPFAFIPLIALGVYFGFVVYRSQNIILAMTAHFLNNAVACIAVYMELQDDFVAVAPSASPSALLVAANTFLFGLVFLASTYYFVRVTKPTAGIVG